MPRPVWAYLVVGLLAAGPIEAQETRGNINGTVHDASGVIPGATVRITNVETGQTQPLVTNGSGYFEAPLLQAGQYRVTVEMAGFKTLAQTGITLSVGQSMTLKLALELGAITEQVDVVAAAPLIDTTSVSSGQNFDKRLVDGLPMASSMPIMVAKFAPGVVPSDTQGQVVSGMIDGTNDAAGRSLGGVGSNNYTIDGATNAGNNRRLATSPNSDMIQEMRVESSNFDASIGHGSGNTISMMTRAGTNAYHGTGSYQYWTNKLNSRNAQQKLTFRNSAEAERQFERGQSNNGAITLGGPVIVPRLVDGRNKLFFFTSFQRNVDANPGRNTPTSTVPANEKHLNGDFSDLLLLPNGTQYQIYDPLTVRPDPARPGSFIRTPFPNNIIPRDRFMNADGSYKNPLFGLYRDMVPAPNQNFLSAAQVPTSNYFQGGQPDNITAQNFAIRVDYNHSTKDRVSFRGSGATYYEDIDDWTYEVPKYQGLHSLDKTRYPLSFTGSWTRVVGQTVFDTQISTNRFNEFLERRQIHGYVPSDVGLPTYLDDYCGAVDNCVLPTVSLANGAYQGISAAADGGLQTNNYQAQTNVTSVKGSHTLRSGVDVRLAKRTGSLSGAGNTSSSYTFDNTYTRAANTTTVFPASNIGLTLAAFMLGIPTSASIAQSTPLSISNPYYGGFFQDTWRVNRNLTINLGLRYEFEAGIKEAEDRAIVGFDPNAVLAITQLAQEAYARNPIPQVPVSQFRVLGGAVYAADAGQNGRTWKGESMWMPRLSGAYKLGEKTVVKAGYGLFFDTLNAGDYNDTNQNGYSVTTTNNISTDFGQTWNFGDPARGISPLMDPFPLRLNGARFEAPVGDTLGADITSGTGFTRENPERRHARVQRWRIGIQRELSRNLSVDIAYTGSYADHVSIGIAQNYVPEQYYNGSNVRDNTQQLLLQEQVTNPFFIGNFAALQTTNPVLYQRMAANSFFTATTVQRQNLLRQYPQLSSLDYRALPLGIVKSHTFEATLNRRFSNGLSGSASFSANRILENRTVEAYDRAPTLWQTNNSGRPYRIVGVAVYEAPFGSGHRFLNHGGVLAAIVGGWQAAGTFEYQPGALLDWGNVFFYGDLADIVKDKPEIALGKDGVVDPTKTWINVDAGFEKDPAKVPAAFQKRVFPFRVDGVRGTSRSRVDMNVVRNVSLASRRTVQVRVEVQNLLNTQFWGNPNLDPTSTNFGKITTVNNSLMRHITFVTRFSF